MIKPKWLLKKLSEYEKLELSWIWEPYIARGMLTILEGDPNVGKSYLTMHMAAIMTIGGTLPDSQKLLKEGVLFLSAEDAAEYTVRPRIEAMGGDSNKVWFPAEPFTFTDESIKKLDQHLENHVTGLIIIDTLFSFLPDGVDTSKPGAIRERLHAMANLAKEHDCAIVVVRHWTKGDRGKAIYRGGGLIDIIGVARSGITIAVHPEDPKLRIMAHMKYNLSERGDSRVFELVKDDAKELPELVWRGVTDITADALEASGNVAPKALETAINFLRQELQASAKQSKLIRQSANAKGIASRTLERAKKELRVISVKRGDGWMWSLPQPA